jgi:DNA-binding transcriptional ArsR family regulator/SAM-dependent methyltransferase
MRLQLLAIGQAEELSIGELSELLDESQPNVSRHVTALRKLGLLSERKHGTRVFVRLADEARVDAVVRDALESGRALCDSSGVFERMPSVIARRDAPAREFFAKSAAVDTDQSSFPAELPAYLAVLAPLIARRSLAIEVGTGDGRLLEALAPVFERVVAVDREDAQLERARQRLARRGHRNVELHKLDFTDSVALASIPGVGQADAVFASRVLHHAPRPVETVRTLASLARPGGHILVLDYVRHDDDSMRDKQADLWLGFSDDELLRHAREAGLCECAVARLPSEFHPGGPDAHLTWHTLVARRPEPSCS